MFNPVTTYGYMLPTMYLFVTDIANPDLFACGCRTSICLDIIRFHEEQCHPSSGSAWPACTKQTVNWVLIAGAGGINTLVGCVVCSLTILLSFCVQRMQHYSKQPIFASLIISH